METGLAQTEQAQTGPLELLSEVIGEQVVEECLEVSRSTLQEYFSERSVAKTSGSGTSRSGWRVQGLQG